MQRYSIFGGLVDDSVTKIQFVRVEFPESKSLE
jgi:hypothetical protein